MVREKARVSSWTLQLKFRIKSKQQTFLLRTFYSISTMKGQANIIGIYAPIFITEDEILPASTYSLILKDFTTLGIYLIIEHHWLLIS